ncbi:MAG: hypothetical protein ACOH19_16520 [Rhodoglobus sp.]
MQLGTRWTVGAVPPARLSDDVRDAIENVEVEISDVPGAREWRWTLTWLESRPVVELDDGTVIRERADGTVTVSRDEESLD